MKHCSLVFPHQLFLPLPRHYRETEIILIEEQLFFRQYAFHLQKLIFHRASMQYYSDHLRKEGLVVRYIDSTDIRADIRTLIPELKKEDVIQVHYTDPTDNWLNIRIEQSCQKAGIAFTQHPNPSFINTSEENEGLLPTSKQYYQTDFYIRQRKKLNILLEQGEPAGGRWTYDTDNRKRYPKGSKPPVIRFPAENRFNREAAVYIQEHYPKNPGISSGFIYPVTHEAAQQWLEDFLRFRFHDFGTYEDAVVHRELILHHSVLSPLLNAGLLTPKQVIHTTLDYSREHRVPLNDLEGFIRQIIGWREFIRAVYDQAGSRQRTYNFWKNNRAQPASFYQGTTGIFPIDQTIHKVMQHAYCHHIERLMVLGNFMLLCDIHPDEVYRWFMELFIDAYDWVMVPNVYGMSQYADGGLMTTKPYISGSNYLMKMSDYPKGEWQQIWDGLFWRFIHRHSDFFLRNPRLSMMAHLWSKMDASVQQRHLHSAESFLAQLG